MNYTELIEKGQLKKQIQQFNVGDTIRVYSRVVEGEKERIQVFEGLVIGRKGSSNRETFTVRKISHGVGVERVFPLHSPRIEDIKVVRRGAVRRAKLYYLRKEKGRAAKVTEKEQRPEEKKEGIEEGGL